MNRQLQPMPAPAPVPPGRALLGYSGKPANPRNLQVSGNTVSWSAPVDTRGIVGYRIYLDKENNLINTVSALMGNAKADPSHTHSVNLKIAPATTHTVFVSSITNQGRESSKIPIAITGAAVAQAVGSTSAPTTTTTTMQQIPEMAVTITANGNNVLILFSSAVTLTGQGSLGANVLFQIYKDGNPLSQVIKATTPVNNLYQSVSLSYMDANVTGKHTYAVYWGLLNAGGTPPITATLDGINRSLQVIEIA
jgi:hypothetical protein